MMRNRSIIIIVIILMIFIFIGMLININKYQPHSPSDPIVWVSKYDYNENEISNVDFNLNRRGRLYFDILLNSEKLKAYFDTGNAFGICVNENAVERKNFQIDGFSNIYNSEGKLIEKSSKFMVDNFHIEGKKFKLNSGIFIKGKYTYFGFSPLKECRITLDYKNKIAAISSTQLPQKIQINEDRAVMKSLTILGSGEGYIVIPIKIKNQEYYAMVDTGASVSVIDKEIANQLNLNQNIFGRVELTDIEIGGFKMNLPSVSVHSQRAVGRGLDKEIMATIGADVLCQYLVTIDYQQNIIVLER